jgi:hypothetical protein
MQVCLAGYGTESCCIFKPKSMKMMVADTKNGRQDAEIGLYGQILFRNC